MEDHWVQANTVKEAQAKRELVELVKHGTADLDNSKFGRVRAVSGRGEDAKIAFHFAFSADGIEQTGNGILWH